MYIFLFVIGCLCFLSLFYYLGCFLIMIACKNLDPKICKRMIHYGDIFLCVSFVFLSVGLLVKMWVVR